MLSNILDAIIPYSSILDAIILNKFGSLFINKRCKLILHDGIPLNLRVVWCSLKVNCVLSLPLVLRVHFLLLRYFIQGLVVENFLSQVFLYDKLILLFQVNCLKTI